MLSSNRASLGFDVIDLLLFLTVIIARRCCWCFDESVLYDQIKLPPVPGNEGALFESLEEGDLKDTFLSSLRKEVYNLFGAHAKLPPEAERYVDKRINGFMRTMYPDKYDQIPDHEKRSEKPRVRRSASDEQIDMETARAEHLYLKGFQERGYVPVNFPIDICLLKIGQTVFAASLHERKLKGVKENNTVVSFYRQDQNGHFEKYMEYDEVPARRFDCISHGSQGFIAVVSYHDRLTEPDGIDDNGSPVFQIQEDSTTEIIQRFSQSNQNSVHMWTHGNHFYLTHTYTNLDESVANFCPLYRWSGLHFDVIDQLPCYNSITIEPFSVRQTLYIAIANQMSYESDDDDESVEQDTFSDIFRFDYETQKFQFHQTIYAYSVSDIAYFFLDYDELRQHFLITGNSRAGSMENKDIVDYDHVYDQDSIVYKYEDGYFVPFQRFTFPQVVQYLPVVRDDGEFLLLVQCAGKPLTIYEYDGWKFVPSQIDYTREAFSDGVSSMRVYRHIMDASLIVIANRNLYGKTTNIFSPIYGVKNSLREVYDRFFEWTQKTIEHLSAINVEDVVAKVQALPNPEDGVLRLDKPVELRNCTVRKLTTKIFRRGKLVLDQRTFDYMNDLNDRIQAVRERARKLQEIVDDTYKPNETIVIKGDLRVPEIVAKSGIVGDLRVQRINNEPVEQTTGLEKVLCLDKLIVEGESNVLFYNGYAKETLVRNSDMDNLENVTLIAKKVEIHGPLYVENEIDGIRFTPDNVLMKTGDQYFNATLKVEHLYAENLNAPMLNSTSMDRIVNYLNSVEALTNSRSARKTVYTDEDLKDVTEIRADHVHLNGTINGIDLDYLMRYALQRESDKRQVFTAPLVIDELIADKIICSNNMISGVDIDTFVLSEKTEKRSHYVIEQDVVFTKPLHVENLRINNQLNHIPVIDGELQVVQLNPDKPQLITGTKVFDYVTVEGPVHVQGKLTGKAMEELTPIQTMDEDVYIEGNFTVNDLTVLGMLNVTNIYGASRTYNYLDLLNHGVRLDNARIDQNITFKQPVTIDDMFASSINGLDPSDFVTSGFGEGQSQYITGRKTFLGDVQFGNSSFIDAANINGINLKKLYDSMLKRSGRDQVIRGNIYFNKVIASHIVSNRTFFAGRPIDTLFRVDNPQPIKSKVRMKNCVLNVRGELNIQRVTRAEQSTFYGYDLDFLLRDSLSKGQGNESVLVTGPKSFDHLIVDELILLDGATMNGIDAAGLKKLWEPYPEELVFHESVEFKNSVEIDNVYFTGSFNGVPAADFGHSWLTKHGNHTFTAPQTFETLIVDEVLLDGYVNGMNWNELVEDVYYVDRPEIVKKAIFHQGVESLKPVTIGGLFSGLNFCSDVFLPQSDKPQYIEEVIVDGTLIVHDRLLIGQTLNGLNYPKLNEFNTATGNEKPLKLQVIGTTYLRNEPHIENLNGYNIAELSEGVVLTDRENIITGNWRFESARFDGDIYLEGTFNGMDVDDLMNNYVRKSVSQNITTPLIFTGNVEFRGGAYFAEGFVKGRLKASPDAEGIDLEEYKKYLFKPNETQTITGRWKVKYLEVYGDVNVTTLNGLNLLTDYLHDKTEEIVFTGSKTWDSVHVRNLICPKPCIIQGVDFDDWYENSVWKNRENQTIQGEIIFENVIVEGDIECVDGCLVNNVTWDEKHLLLKDREQTIEGDLYLNSDNVTIDRLDVEFINGKNFTEFMENVALESDDSWVIESDLTVTQPIEVENLHLGDEGKLFGVPYKQLMDELNLDDEFNAFNARREHLTRIHGEAERTMKQPALYLREYKSANPLPGRFRSVSTITLPLSPVPRELLIAHVKDGDHTAVEFYRWHRKEQRFLIAGGFPPIFSRKLIITNAKRIRLGLVENLFIEFYHPKEHYHRQTILDLEPPDLLEALRPKPKMQKFATIYEFNSTVPRDLVPLRVRDMDCVMLYSAEAPRTEIWCVHLENLLYLMRHHQTLDTPPIKQALFLDGRLILLTATERLQIWRPQLSYLFVRVQQMNINRPTHMTAVRFEHQLFLAVCSSAVGRSDGLPHQGSVQILRNLRPSSLNSTFTRYQEVLMVAPRHIQLSIIPATSDLMLYILSESRFHPFMVYQYEGVAGFKEYLKSKTFRLDASRLDVIKLDGRKRELVGLITDNEVYLIEARFS